MTLDQSVSFLNLQQELIHEGTRLIRLKTEVRGGPASIKQPSEIDRRMLAQATLQKLKNAESSLVFMREQHARTLEGLHEEIHKLQKKNASEFSTLKFCPVLP